MNKKKIVLASKSPRRSELLRQMGMEFAVLVSDADENIEAGSPAEFVMELSKIKAKAVYEELDDKDVLVIGADTVVVHNDKILGKPKDAEDCINILKNLSGDVHEVMTGVTLIDVNENVPTYHTFYETTKVYMHEISEEEIFEYVNGSKTDEQKGDVANTQLEWADKAGGYAIQGTVGAKFIKKIEGDYNNVVGLPAAAIYQKIKEIKETKLIK